MLRGLTMACLFPSLAWGQVHLIPGHDRIPPEFDKPYTGYLAEYEVPLAKVGEACRVLVRYSGSYEGLHGCAMRFTDSQGRKGCVVVYNDGSQSTRKHEHAHCWGWQHP